MNLKTIGIHEVQSEDYQGFKKFMVIRDDRYARFVSGFNEETKRALADLSGNLRYIWWWKLSPKRRLNSFLDLCLATEIIPAHCCGQNFFVNYYSELCPGIAQVNINELDCYLKEDLQIDLRVIDKLNVNNEGFKALRRNKEYYFLPHTILLSCLRVFEKFKRPLTLSDLDDCVIKKIDRILND